jgi:tetratricopeptide (TPR) repeat protein
LAAPPFVRSMARAILLGRTFDRGFQAARDDNKDAFISAYNELRRLKATAKALDLAQSVRLDPAEEAVWQALIFDVTADQVGGTVGAELQARSTAQYRRALQLNPRFDSPDPVKLNALGYFLAERGVTPDDFKTAERLTRRALLLWDEAIQQLKQRGEDTLRPAMQRANTRDSLAWALYRQGQLKKALSEQQNAVAEAKARAGKGAGEVSEELYFHLGEIYRSLRRWNDARRQYEEALKVDPNHAESRRALESLTPGSGKSAPLVPDLPDEPPAPFPTPEMMALRPTPKTIAHHKGDNA